MNLIDLSNEEIESAKELTYHWLTSTKLKVSQFHPNLQLQELALEDCEADLSSIQQLFPNLYSLKVINSVLTQTNDLQKLEHLNVLFLKNQKQVDFAYELKTLKEVEVEGECTVDLRGIVNNNQLMVSVKCPNYEYYLSMFAIGQKIHSLDCGTDFEDNYTMDQQKHYCVSEKEITKISDVIEVFVIKNVQKLDISYANIKSLTEIPRSASVTSLNLYECPISNLKGIAQYPNLTEIDVSWQYDPKGPIRSFEGIPVQNKIESIKAVNTRIYTCKGLENCFSLKELNVSGDIDNTSHFVSFEGIPNNVEKVLAESTCIETLGTLRNCKNLIVLHVGADDQCSCTLKSIVQLNFFPLLEDLDIIRQVYPKEQLVHINNLKKLKKLGCSLRNWDEEDLTEILACVVPDSLETFCSDQFYNPEEYPDGNQISILRYKQEEVNIMSENSIIQNYRMRKIKDDRIDVLKNKREDVKELKGIVRNKQMLLKQLVDKVGRVEKEVEKALGGWK